MTHSDDLDNQLIVKKIINDPLIADSNSVCDFRAAEFFSPGRPAVGCEGFYSGQYLRDFATMDLFKLFYRTSFPS